MVQLLLVIRNIADDFHSFWQDCMPVQRTLEAIELL